MKATKTQEQAWIDTATATYREAHLMLVQVKRFMRAHEA